MVIQKRNRGKLFRFGTFFTPILISSINKQETGTLWEPGQNQELHKRRDAGGGEQDGPVLFFPQDFSAQLHTDATFCFYKNIANCMFIRGQC